MFKTKGKTARPDLTARLWPDCVGNPLSIRKKAEFGALWPISRSF
ncbi:hypothetical protein [Bradyrhizobium mercantei]|nr:hypothetical protein [Bradyrhizobium mercantei]